MNFTIELTAEQQEAIAKKQELLKAEYALVEGKGSNGDLTEAKETLRRQRAEYREKYRPHVMPLEALGLDITADSVTVRPGQSGVAVSPGGVDVKGTG